MTLSDAYFFIIIVNLLLELLAQQFKTCKH